MKKVKEVIGKYKVYLIGLVFVLLFFSAKSCNEKRLNQLSGENKILKEQVKKEKDGLSILETQRLREKDSTRLENIKKEQQIKALKDRELASLDKVKDLQKNALKSKAVIKSLSLDAVAQELNVNYGGNNATVEGNTIVSKDYLPYQLVETVIDFKASQGIIKEKDIQLGIKDSVIFIKDNQIKSSSILLVSAEKSLTSSKNLNQLQTDLNKNLEKENSKLRTKSTLNKILIPVAGAIGIFIGVKSTKQ